MVEPLEPQVLRPFRRDEVMDVSEAAIWAGKSKRTIRDWCLLHDLGRRIGGQWAVSKVALSMWLDGAHEELKAYLSGDRQSPRVRDYFYRCEVPLPLGFSSEKNDYRNQSNPNV